MKKYQSLSFKWALAIGGIIIAIVLIGLMINHFFFYDYYLDHEKRDMLTFAESFDQTQENQQAAQDLVSQAQAFKKITIGIVTDSDRLNFDYDLLKSHLILSRELGSRVQIDYPKDAQKQLDNFGYFFLDIHEYEDHIPSLGLIYRLKSGEVLLLSMPLEVADRTANIAIEFNVLISVFLVLTAMVGVFILTKTMTKPIVSLSNMTKRMADLDFSQRFQGRSHDEISLLGDHVNLMSHTLESTLIDLKNSNDQLIKDLEEKDKIVEMRKSFITNVSHELKTPIALIMSYTEGLRMNHHLSPDQKADYLQVIEKEAAHMDRLVKDLLDLTELEYDATSLTLASFDLSALIDEILDRYILWIGQKKIKVFLDKEDIHMVKGDRHRIEQGVMNLIINAIDHCEDQGSLRISLMKKEGNHAFSIYNSGSHLDCKEPQALFHRFYKASDSSQRQMGGSGVGLSILAAVMEKHKGKYGARNHQKGVEFWFTLPDE